MSETVRDPTHKKGLGAYEKTVIKLKDRYKLGDYLRAHQEEFARDRPTFQAVAERVTADLGFAVTESAVRTAAKVLEILWSPKRKQLKTLIGKTNVYRRVRLLEAQVIALRTALVEVYTRVGETLPAELVPASAGAVNGRWPEPAKPLTLKLSVED